VPTYNAATFGWLFLCFEREVRFSVTLVGPADADAFRIDGDRGKRFYVDPLPGCDIAPDDPDGQYPSVSAVKKAARGDWSFVERRRHAEALLADPERFTRLKTAKEIQDALYSAGQADLAKASDRGTFVHKVCEDLLYGREPYTEFATPDQLAYLPAVYAFFDTYQPELIAAETVAFHRDLHGVGYAGTADAFMRVHLLSGPAVVIGDFKSRGADSKHGAYPEEAAQIAAYATAQYLVVEGDNGAERVRVPELDGGLIISIKPDGVRLYPIHLEKAAEHWTALHRWYVAKQSERASIGRQLPAKKPAPPRESPDYISQRLTEASTVDELNAVYYASGDQWTPAHIELARVRKAALQGK